MTIISALYDAKCPKIGAEVILKAETDHPLPIAPTANVVESESRFALAQCQAVTSILDTLHVKKDQLHAQNVV